MFVDVRLVTLAKWLGVRSRRLCDECCGTNGAALGRVDSGFHATRDIGARIAQETMRKLNAMRKLLGIVPIGHRRLRNNGCFNYFIRDIRAPKLRDNDLGLPVKTHWRLLWEDKRYTDGVIPDESEYFLEGPQPNCDIVA